MMAPWIMYLAVIGTILALSVSLCLIAIAIDVCKEEKQ